MIHGNMPFNTKDTPSKIVEILSWMAAQRSENLSRDFKVEDLFTIGGL
jgi:hypothetical protein